MNALLSRILAPFIGGLAAWLGARGVTAIDADWVNATTEIVVMLVLGLIAYGTGHKIIDKKVNPTDSASEAAADRGADL